jgi:hypothetical protein
MQTVPETRGKIFTDVVSTRPVPVIVQTRHNRILGDFHVRPDWRLKDEVNEQDAFVALTDVEVYDESGAQVFKAEFMVLRRDSIEWIVPEAGLDSDSVMVAETKPDKKDE